MNAKTTIPILFLVLIVIALAILIFAPRGDAQGCVNQAAIYAANDAGYKILYHHGEQMEAIKRAIQLAYTSHAPSQYITRLLIAKRYWQSGHRRLAAYHLIYASQHSCY